MQKTLAKSAGRETYTFRVLGAPPLGLPTWGGGSVSTFKSQSVAFQNPNFQSGGGGSLWPISQNGPNPMDFGQVPHKLSVPSALGTSWSPTLGGRVSHPGGGEVGPISSNGRRGRGSRLPHGPGGTPPPSPCTPSQASEMTQPSHCSPNPATS